jgi:hypothetical protein
MKTNLTNNKKRFLKIIMKWKRVFIRRSFKPRKQFRCVIIFVLTFSITILIWKNLSADVSAKNHLKNCSNLGLVENLIFSFSRKFLSRESLCSQKATLRGPGQKVIAYSFFGKVRDENGDLSWYSKVGMKSISSS